MKLSPALKRIGAAVLAPASSTGEIRGVRGPHTGPPRGKVKKGNKAMKRSILILFLVIALMTGTAYAGCIPTVEFDSAAFDGGMISGIFQDGSALYATDIQNKVVWRIENGKPEVFAGDRTYRDINGIVIADHFDAEADKARFMEPWAIVPFLDGWAVSDASANTVR